jgi:hypothetical protein
VRKHVVNMLIDVGLRVPEVEAVLPLVPAQLIDRLAEWGRGHRKTADGHTLERDGKIRVKDPGGIVVVDGTDALVDRELDGRELIGCTLRLHGDCSEICAWRLDRDRPVTFEVGARVVEPVEAVLELVDAHDRLVHLVADVVAELRAGDAFGSEWVTLADKLARWCEPWHAADPDDEPDEVPTPPTPAAVVETPIPASPPEV